MICETIPPRHLARLTALPVAAVVTYAALLGADPSTRAIRTYILEPVVATQTVLGWALFVAALVSVRREGVGSTVVRSPNHSCAEVTMSGAAIAGYTYCSTEASPVTMGELSLLRASVLFGGEDEAALREAGTILAGQVEQVLDVWYGFVGANPQLLAHFSTLDGEPIGDYLTEVRGRFGQWIRDTCERPYDEAWLAYQHEMAFRHTPDRKNLTDGVSSTSHVPLRYLIALIYPIAATIRPFLASESVPPERVEAMHEAWRKSVILQIALWSPAYAPDLW